MNLAFCKIGKSIRFKYTGDTMGGEMEAPLMLRLLANNNPNSKFYLIGRSDFSRLSSSEKSALFDYDNIVDLMHGFKKDQRDFIQNKLKMLGVRLDTSIMMVGQVGIVTIPNKIKRIKNPDLTATAIGMTMNYSTPIVEFHNENLDLPVIEICNDPRYVLDQARDIIFVPNISLSQYNEEYVKRHIKSYKDQSLIYTAVQQTYNEMEKVFLYQKQMLPINVAKREKTFTIILNEGKPSRYKTLHEWVLKHQEDVEVYGVWDEKYTSKDSRFKGTLDSKNLIQHLANYRATLAIPIKTGWVTSKYIEMIWMGVVPFFHPTYDDQNHTNVPEFLRPKTPAELYERVQLLQQDEIYLKVITSLQKQFCKPEYFDGTRLNQIVMTAVNADYTKPHKTEKTLTADNLEDFF